MPFRKKEFIDLWVNSYGKEKIMEEGANSIIKALTAKIGIELVDNALPAQSDHLPSDNQITSSDNQIASTNQITSTDNQIASSDNQIASTRSMEITKK